MQTGAEAIGAAVPDDSKQEVEVETLHRNLKIYFFCFVFTEMLVRYSIADQQSQEAS